MTHAEALQPSTVRCHLVRRLRGDGPEIGPVHGPFPLQGRGVSVRYMDRWEPTENSNLFPDSAVFPEPDVVANLDSDRLSAVADESADFVIASHALEHLADPVGMLAELQRVLRDAVSPWSCCLTGE